MPASPCVLAFDLGTSGAKSAVVDATGGVVARGYAPVELLLLPGGGAEQDPAAWWSALRTAARQALGEAPAGTEIVGVGTTAQWSGTVSVDASGEAIGNAILWMDARGAAAIGALIDRAGEGEPFDGTLLGMWLMRCGGAPGRSGKDSLAHILYLAAHQRERYDRSALFLEPADYLGLRMTGRAAATHDSITLHWVTDNRNVRDVSYDDAIVAACGLDRGKLPELVPSNSVLGNLLPGAAADLGLAPGIPVVCGSADVHSAIIGSGAVADYAPHCYIGTSSWVTCHVPEHKLDVDLHLASIPAALPGRYLVGNEHITAGACLTFLRDNMLFADDRFAEDVAPPGDFGVLEEVAGSVSAGSNGVLFTPWLHGERTPVDDDTIRGGFHNLSLTTKRADLVRAVYEGVAYNSRWLHESVGAFVASADPDWRTRSVRFVGGGARSDVWARIHADVLGCAVEQVEDPTFVNARGAGLLAHLALGHIRESDLASAVPIRAVYEPDMDARAVHDRHYGCFVDLYHATAAIHRRLNGAAPDA